MHSYMHSSYIVAIGYPTKSMLMNNVDKWLQCIQLAITVECRIINNV